MCLDLGVVTILQPRFEFLEASEKSRENGRRNYLIGNTSNPEQPSILVHIERRPTDSVGLEEARPQVVNEP